jgi:heat shock protein HtpX
MPVDQCIESPGGVMAGGQEEPGRSLVRRNRFRTRLLLAGFVLLAAPLAAFLGSYLSLSLAVYLAPGFFHGVRGLCAQLFTTLVLTALLIRRVVRASRSLPQNLGARPLPRWAGAVLWRRLDSLASAAEIPAPRLYLLPVSNANAFSAGPDPKRASIVVTRGLLERLSLRELDGVLAHELSHVVNQDARLNSMAAAIFRTVRLLVFVFWPMALSVVLVAILAPGGAAVMSLWPVRHEAPSPFVMGWSANGVAGAIGSRLELAASGCLAAGLLLALLWPAIARRLRRTFVAENESAADAQAVRITGDPLGLACALAKICGGAAGQFSEEAGEEGPARAGCRPWPKGGAWRKGTPSWNMHGGGRLKPGSGVGRACFAPLEGGREAALARIGALRAMAPDETFDVTRELPEPEVIAVAALGAIANRRLFFRRRDRMARA